MPGLVETVESQQRAFHEFPQALGNLAHHARFPHSLGSDERAEKWKTKNRFSTFPRYCSNRFSRRQALPSVGPEHKTNYRCHAHPWVTFLFDPTEPGLGYFIK